MRYRRIWQELGCGCERIALDARGRSCVGSAAALTAFCGRIALDGGWWPDLGGGKRGLGGPRRRIIDVLRLYARSFSNEVA